MDFYSKYDISETYGFLTHPESMPTKLPEGFEYLQKGIDLLEVPNTDCDEFLQYVESFAKNSVRKSTEHYHTICLSLKRAEIKYLYTILTFIVQKHIKMRPEVIDTIPYEIGIPWHFVGSTLKIPNGPTYFAVVLANTVCEPEVAPNGAELNAKHGVSNTLLDEKNFYNVHVQIEHEGAKLLRTMFECEKFSSSEVLIDLMDTMMVVFDKCLKHFKTMRYKCAPEKFASSIRMYMGGYNKETKLADGLKVENTDIVFHAVGGSGAQSSLIQSFDICLGIDHDPIHGTRFLAEQQSYMIEDHRNYLQDMEKKYKEKSMKQWIAEQPDPDVRIALAEKYNKTLTTLYAFRTVHIGVVHSFIGAFTQNRLGNGGLDTRNLKNFRDDTEKPKYSEDALDEMRVKAISKDRLGAQGKSSKQGDNNAQWMRWLAILLPIIALLVYFLRNNLKL